MRGAAVDRLRAQQVAQRHPVRLLHRQRPAGHRRPPEPREAPVRAQVREEDLAAPERAVVAHAQAVVGDAQERGRDAVLGGAGRHVRVVVLDGDALPGREPLQGVLGGQVLGVEVVDDDLGLQGEEPREVGEAVREGAVGREVLEVAVVRGDVGAPAARERERVLELGAHGEQRHRRRDRQRQGLRRVPAGAAHDGLAPRDHARDRVVVAGPDLAVVGEEPVREAGEAREGVRRRPWPAARP